MDIQLQELINKIKEEGVGEADRKGNEIIEEKKKEASVIMERAYRDADKLVADAEERVKKLKEAGEEALQQASRDLILNVKNKLTSLFKTIIEQEVADALDDKIMEEVILSIVKSWNIKDSGDMELLLPKDKAKKLGDYLISKLGKSLKKGVTISPYPDIQSGFRIMEKDGNAYYDFTDEGIGESLMRYVNPMFAEIIKGSVEEE